MHRNDTRRNKFMIWLIFTYFIVIVIRYVLILATTSFPTVGIDEYLYYSLGRSIATEGKLLFRGQNANYVYIVYPLILSPVYLFAWNGANIYRLIQLWNTILMSASVFPLYFLCKKTLGSEKKAYFITILTMLLPDFILGGLIFSETIIFPLFYTLLYCAYAYLRNGNRKCILWIGMLGGVLYSTKPGAVVPAVVFLILLLIGSARYKKGKDALYGLVSIALLILTTTSFFVLAKVVFGYEGSILSIYQTQVEHTSGLKWIDIFTSAVSYPFYFILSCGIIGFIYPLICSKDWNEENLRFLYFVLISLAVMMIGAVWAIEPATVLNNIHLRYVAMYIPLFLIFCGIPQQESRLLKKKKENRTWQIVKTAAIPSFLILYCLFFGCKEKANTADGHAFLSMSLLNDTFLPVSKEMLGNAIIILLSTLAFVLLITKTDRKKTSMICLAVMSATMLINGILGYSIHHNNFFPNLEKDGMKVQELVDETPYIYLLSNEGIVDMGVDVNSKQNNCIVYTNDFMNCLQENNGVYTPYVPEKMRGMACMKKTPDVDMLVVDYDSYPYMKLSEYASADMPDEHPTVYTVRFEKGKRLVDSTLSNLSSHVLTPGKPGILLIYNEEYYNKPITIRLRIESGITQEMTINSTHEIYNVALEQGEKWYDIRFNNAEEAFNFQVQDASIKVNAYELIHEG